jgi:hypothetical protein
VAIHQLWIAASKSLTNYLIYKTKNCRGSIDDWGVVALTQTILPITCANTSIMSKCRNIALGLYKLQHPKSFTLCGRSISDWHCNHVTISFAHNGCEYFDYGELQLHSPWIIHDATPKIVDTLLTLCWHSVDTLLTLYWCSVDALLTLCWRSVCGVTVLTHTILPIKAANTSIMGKCHSTALGLFKMKHTKSLKLCWRSFSDWGCDYIAISFPQNGCQYADSG